MSQVSVSGVCKAFGGRPVLRGVDLDVPAGSLTAVLGPSGCGKTTLLRLVAGFDTPDAGTIAIGGRTVSDGRRGLPPERRGVGYVAQEGALFPHLDVAANIGFGLSRATRRRTSRVAELLHLVGLPADYTDRYPHQLSGGQQQRVALARALAPQPAVVLLDEPFAALDAGLRVETRRAVAAALAETGSTAVLVTHDQGEALSVADQVAVMREGTLVQTASPDELYRRPADLWVAYFVGDATALPATVHGSYADCALGTVPVEASFTGPGELMIRPEQLRIHDADTCGAAGAPAYVDACTYYGHDATVALRLSVGDTVLMARCSGEEMPRPGDRVTVTLEGRALVYPDLAGARAGVGARQERLA